MFLEGEIMINNMSEVIQKFEATVIEKVDIDIESIDIEAIKEAKMNKEVVYKVLEELEN